MFNPFFSPGNITEMPPEMILTMVEHMDLESIENLRSTNRQFRAVIDDNNVIQKRMDDIYNQLVVANRNEINEIKNYDGYGENLTDADALLLLATGYSDDVLNYQNTIIALKKGADPNRLRVDGEPYLYNFVSGWTMWSSPPKKFLKLLLDYGADPDSEDEGQNILHLIVDEHSAYVVNQDSEIVDIVEMFIQKGAEIDYINRDPYGTKAGYTPCMVVKDHNPERSPHKQALIELFQAYGAECEVQRS